ncbi:MAG: hypothetical protein U9R58_08200 [Chloroflexota bacterium]|nr:hypothetical protein [Chloroflexota bacterium]
MLKKILIITLAVLVIGAVGVSLYNVSGQKATSAKAAFESPPDDGQLNGHSWQANPVSSRVETETDTIPNSDIPESPPTDVLAEQDMNATFEGQAAVQPAINTTSATGQANGSGKGAGNGRRGNRWGGTNENAGAGEYAEPDPQNEFVEWQVFQGRVSDYIPPALTLLTGDGNAIPIQLGNQAFLSNLGLELQDGDTVTITGYWDSSGEFAAGQITLDATGESFILRDDLGRPLWGGGPNR